MLRSGRIIDQITCKRQRSSTRWGHRRARAAAKIEHQGRHDDYTPREFVVSLLKAVFRMSESQAYAVMITAHRRGASSGRRVRPGLEQGRGATHPLRGDRLSAAAPAEECRGRPGRALALRAHVCSRLYQVVRAEIEAVSSMKIG